MKTKNYQRVMKMPLMLLLFLGINFNSTAQSCSSPPSCLYNPNFATSNGGDINPGSTSITGWYRSHGTPQVILSGGHNGLNAIEMASQAGGGDGIFACYNFKKNRQYKLCFWVKDGGGASTGGTLNIKAANGLTEPSWPVLSGGYNLPNPSAQLIDNSYSYSAGWTQVSVTYTPSVDYNQLWIYPYSTVALPSQYKVHVSDIVLFEAPLGYSVSVPCEGTITLNSYAGGCGSRTDWYDMDSKYIGTGTVVISDALPSMSGTYTMKVTNGDCIYSIAVGVNVQECNCNNVVPDFEKVGGGLTVQFNETTTGPGTSVGWYWDFGDGATSNDENPSHVFSNEAHYTVCLTIIRKVGDQTCCTKICKNVQVGMPTEGFVAPKEGFGTNLLNYPNNTIKFSNNTLSRGVVQEYRWDFGDGHTSGSASPTHVYSSSGTYQVCLSVADDIYDEAGNLTERVENQYCQTLEVKVGKATEVKEGIATVMPNPATNEAVVTVENLPNAKVTLHSIAGEQVAVGKLVEKDRYLLQLQQLPSGMYIVEVKSDSGSRTMKLIKE